MLNNGNHFLVVVKIKVVILSYKSFLKKNIFFIKKFNYLINCSTNFNYINNAYQKNNDQDLIIAKKNIYLKKFEKIGLDIGLLFQIADDLIDFKGNTKKVGKKTRKDLKKGKATLIRILGHKNTIKYGNKIKLSIFKRLNFFGTKSKNLKDTINYILERSK